MTQASEYQVIRPGLFFWQAYDASVKTELCCCAIETGEGVVFCDPIALVAEALEELMEGKKGAGILLTNGNHERGAVALAKRLGIEIWAHGNARDMVAATRWFEDGERVCGVEAVALEGFAVGETAYWADGLLVMGDALINVEPYGFAMLPDKYCEDAKAGRESLERLLPLPVTVMTFAHGLPLVAQAGERLRALVDEKRRGE